MQINNDVEQLKTAKEQLAAIKKQCDIAYKEMNDLRNQGLAALEETKVRIAYLEDINKRIELAEDREKTLTSDIKTKEKAKNVLSGEYSFIEEQLVAARKEIEQLRLERVEDEKKHNEEIARIHSLTADFSVLQSKLNQHENDLIRRETKIKDFAKEL